MEVYSQLTQDLFSADTINPNSYMGDERRQQAMAAILEVVNTGLVSEGQQTVGPTNIIYANYISALSTLQEYYGLVPATRLASVCQENLANTEEFAELEAEEELRCSPELVPDLRDVVSELGMTQEAQRFAVGAAEVIAAQGWPVASLNSLRNSVLSYVRLAYPSFNGSPEVFTEDDIIGFIRNTFRANGLYRATALDTYQEVRTKVQLALSEDQDIDFNEVLVQTAERVFDEKLEATQEVLANKDQYEAKERVLRAVIGIR